MLYKEILIKKILDGNQYVQRNNQMNPSEKLIIRIICIYKDFLICKEVRCLL